MGRLLRNRRGSDGIPSFVAIVDYGNPSWSHTPNQCWWLMPHGTSGRPYWHSCLIWFVDWLVAPASPDPPRKRCLAWVEGGDLRTYTPLCTFFFRAKTTLYPALAPTPGRSCRLCLVRTSQLRSTTSASLVNMAGRGSSPKGATKVHEQPGRGPSHHPWMAVSVNVGSDGLPSQKHILDHPMISLGSTSVLSTIRPSFVF